MADLAPVGRLAPQLVVFDLDGTLTDSAEGVVASFKHALASVGFAVPDGDLAAQVVGPPMDETMRRFKVGDRASEAVAAYRSDYDERGWAMNSVYDGIGRLLADLRAAGVRLAVATSKQEHMARRILAHFDLDKYFEVIAGASLDGSCKTKEEVLAYALRQMVPLPEQVVMVGDRRHDVEGAAAHGINAVIVGWGYGQADFIGEARVGGPTHVATIVELRQVLGV